MAKTGRPKLDISWEIVDSACAFNAEMTMVVNLLNMHGYQCCSATVENKIREKENCTFSEYRAKRFDDTKMKLQQKALAMALGGHAAMMIFCLKNLCKWTDNNKEEITVKQEQPETVVVYKTAWGSVAEGEPNAGLGVAAEN